MSSFDDLVRLVETAAGSRPIDLVAQSMGGVVALMVALRRVVAIDRIVLAATSGRIDATTKARLQHNWAAEYHRVFPYAARWISQESVDLTDSLRNIHNPVSECVVNLPTPEMWQTVEKLAPLTGKSPVPDLKAKQFRYEKNKFGAAGVSPMPSEIVRPDRVTECPVQMEARVHRLTKMTGERLQSLGGGVAVEVEILRVHVDTEYILAGSHIDPGKWSPLLYNFRHYFALANSELSKTFRA